MILLKLELKEFEKKKKSLYIFFTIKRRNYFNKDILLF